MKLSVPFCYNFWPAVLRVLILPSCDICFSVNPKMQDNSFHVLCSGLCCWMAPAAEHLDCNCFPGHLICSELLSSAGRALGAAWVPAAGQAAGVKLSQFQPCSPFQEKLLCSELSHLH